MSRLFAAAGLIALGLGAAACSSGQPTAVTSSTMTSASTTATKSKCPDFLAADYIDKPAELALVVKSQGWFVDFKKDNVSAAVVAPQGMIVTGFDKHEFGCSVVFKVRDAVPTSVAPPEPVKPAGVTEGTYLVGTDIEPGTYKSPGGSAGCYWGRAKDDAHDKIIANDFSEGPQRFTAKKGEYVKIMGSCTFTKI